MKPESGYRFDCTRQLRAFRGTSPQREGWGQPADLFSAGLVECLHSPFCRSLEVFSFNTAFNFALVSQLKPSAEIVFGGPIERSVIMKQISLLLALAGVFLVSSSRADTLVENFATNPLANGWSIFGETNLFSWDSTNQSEDVTWDSSQPDSFLYRPLGNVLAMDDDFSLSFDLRLFDAVGYNYSMQLAVDLFRFSDATNASYSRADATLPNVFEFGYFPDVTGFGDYITDSLYDTNASFYTASGNQALNSGITYSVTLWHTAGATNLTGQVLANGDVYSSLPSLYSYGAVGDFRLDTVSISCFQDDGYGDSILAHGSVANLVVTLPPPPVQNLAGYFTNGVWAASFATRTNWMYSLQRSPDLQHWTEVNSNNAGTGASLVLFDPSPAITNAFYRILAQRP